MKGAGRELLISWRLGNQNRMKRRTNSCCGLLAVTLKGADCHSSARRELFQRGPDIHISSTGLQFH
jgi:hypothetical protein